MKQHLTLNNAAFCNFGVAVISIILQIIWMAKYGAYEGGYAYASAGLWGGAFFIVTGILCRMPDKRDLSLIFAVLSAVSGIVMVALSSRIVDIRGWTVPHLDNGGYAALQAFLIISGLIATAVNVFVIYLLVKKNHN